MALVAEELARWGTHRASLQPAPEKAISTAAEAASWLWRAACFLGAACGGIIHVSSVRPDHARRVSAQKLSAQAVDESRRWQAERATADAMRKAGKYMELYAEDQAAAERFLSTITASRGIGLPDAMEDSVTSGSFLFGDDVLAGAAEYISRRACDREEGMSAEQRQLLRDQAYSSYRTLSTNTVELRLAEELVALLRKDSIWAVARQVRLIRADLGLPLGELFTDLAGTFDTGHPPALILSFADGAGLTREDLMLAAGMVQGSAVHVVPRAAQSHPVHLEVGMPEGRRLAPAFFVCTAQCFSKVLDPLRYAGVGLNPFEAAVLAYHMHAQAVASDVIPGIPWCTSVAAACEQGQCAWGDAMRQAPSHADQCSLLDVAAPIRIGLTQFIDDNCCRSSSRGGLVMSAQLVRSAVASFRGSLRLGPGKTECMAQGIPDERPIDDIHFVQQCVALGIPIEAGARMIGLMRRIEGRAQTAWDSALMGIELLGLPLQAALASLRGRVQPRACHGTALLLVRGDWEARLDAVFDRWVSRLLELSSPVPRVDLLREVGRPWRLSTRTLRDALALQARVEALPMDCDPRRVSSVAAGCASSWTAAVGRCAAALQVRGFRQWAAASCSLQPQDLTKPAWKRLIKRYLQEEVDPRLHAREIQWQGQERTKYAPRGAAVAIDALRLQGRFSVTDGQAALKCRWCHQECADGSAHFLACSCADAAAADAAAGTPWEGMPAAEVFRRCREDADALTAVTVARPSNAPVSGADGIEICRLSTPLIASKQGQSRGAQPQHEQPSFVELAGRGASGVAASRQHQRGRQEEHQEG
ncbi:unnamed protein product [Prorocentrum cordatum]|uniref:RNA-directed RNA polymerase n=1 Tax=Prorocentrum cordatum TaxID=2364126 RepID=A0ABN9Y2E9_9DINO|nr:unnamed protein product [Polarella glacialis]